MLQRKLGRGSLLYHCSHGLCRITKLMRQRVSGKKVLLYSLEPKATNTMKARFIIPASAMEASGFHSLVSAAEADEILNYLGAGGPPPAGEGAGHEAAELARAVFSFSHDPASAKDQRSRQRMALTVNGLAGELAAAFKITLNASALLIQKSLGDASKINPRVLSALQHVIQS